MPHDELPRELGARLKESLGVELRCEDRRRRRARRNDRLVRRPRRSSDYRPAAAAASMMSRAAKMNIFDCHSHWGTKRGCIFRTRRADWPSKRKSGRRRSISSPARKWLIIFASITPDILDLSFTKFLPIEEIREHHDYAFALQRENPDAIFGHWLQFDPRRALEWIREFDRAMSRRCRIYRPLRQRSGDQSPGERPALGPFYQLDHRGQSSDHDTDRAHRYRAGLYPGGKTAMSSITVIRVTSIQSRRATRS